MMTKFVNKSRFVSFQAKKVITQIERKKKSQQLDPKSIIYPWPQSRNAAQVHNNIMEFQKSKIKI